jgi:hypothetical protein
MLCQTQSPLPTFHHSLRAVYPERAKRAEAPTTWISDVAYSPTSVRHAWHSARPLWFAAHGPGGGATIPKPGTLEHSETQPLVERQIAFFARL